jgi:hypothetical protein
MTTEVNQDTARVTEAAMWQNAKEGDTFYAFSFPAFSYSWNHARALKVVRTTKTLIILEGDIRVSKATHVEPSQAYSTTSYHPATPNVIRRIAEAKAAQDLKERSSKALEKAATLKGDPDFVAQLEALLEKF